MYSVRDNKVVHVKGTKPFSIKEAQRLVRDKYLELCRIKPERNTAIAKVVLLSQYSPDILEMIKKESPLFLPAIESAARAYYTAGERGLNKKMYHMDLYVKTSDLMFSIREMSCPQIKELRDKCAGASEICFAAVEELRS